VRTYKANNYCDPFQHHFNEDIRDVTLSHQDGVSDQQAAEHIRQHIPEHDVLLAGFPCQPFSLAGVSKKNALGGPTVLPVIHKAHFFDVVRIIDARRPAIFVLENVKNLKSHDQGKTFRIIMQTLDELVMTWQMRQITVRMIRKLSMGNIFASTSRTYRACRLPTRSEFEIRLHAAGYCHALSAAAYYPGGTA
jgi:DNA-cytosine methyltransferase